MSESAQVVDLLIALISAKSVTPDDAGLMEKIAAYFDGFEVIRRDEGGVKNLFVTRRFGEGKHLCFAGHVDVVPAGAGWESDPFVPMIREGVLYGRGAQDMKSGVAAAMAALREAPRFPGRLSLLLTSDEEGEATHGTQIMLACGFQDLTGQRINKVVSTLAFVEERVHNMISIWGEDAFSDLPVSDKDDTEEKPEDSELLNGPQLQGEGISQDDIDKLFD